MRDLHTHRSKFLRKGFGDEPRVDLADNAFQFQPPDGQGTGFGRPRALGKGLTSGGGEARSPRQWPEGSLLSRSTQRRILRGGEQIPQTIAPQALLLRRRKGENQGPEIGFRRRGSTGQDGGGGDEALHTHGATIRQQDPSGAEGAERVGQKRSHGAEIGLP